MKMMWKLTGRCRTHIRNIYIFFKLFDKFNETVVITSNILKIFTTE